MAHAIKWETGPAKPWHGVERPEVPALVIEPAASWTPISIQEAREALAVAGAYSLDSVGGLRGGRVCFNTLDLWRHVRRPLRPLPFGWGVQVRGDVSGLPRIGRGFRAR